MTLSETEPLKTLMLIDDNAFDQMVYKRIAKKSGLVECLLQYIDAREALAYLRDPKCVNPDLILLDINMPKMDGFEFLEAVTEEFGIDLCPIVVMLTTSLNPKDATRASNYKVVRDFLNKPLTLDQLTALIKQVNTKGGFD